MPTNNNLNEIFEYDKKTGVLKYRVARGGMLPGDRVGFQQTRGYWVTRINGRPYLIHRVIWTMLYGPIPAKMQIDHINGDKGDNRLINLRLVTATQNNQNRAIGTRNTTGVKGVYWRSARKRFVAEITVDGRRIKLGHFKRVEDAAAARWAAECHYGFLSKEKATPLDVALAA